jgi:hypothetical protein
LVGGQNGPKKALTKLSGRNHTDRTTEMLAPLLLGIDI